MAPKCACIFYKYLSEIQQGRQGQGLCPVIKKGRGSKKGLGVKFLIKFLYLAKGGGRTWFEEGVNENN